MKLIGSALVPAFVLMSQGAAQTAKTAHPKVGSRDCGIALRNTFEPLQKMARQYSSVRYQPGEISNRRI
jgi:hypothetical protein